jgi:DegV family protein with EDD domain
MPGIAVITDTDSSLPLELAESYSIQLVPITIHFGEESFEAVYSLSDAETFQRIDKEGKLPTTSAPSPGKFMAAYSNAFTAGAEQILCLCVSSEVSATYNAALSACESFPGREIRVIDSRSLSMGLGYMALDAAEAAKRGACMEDILSVIENTRKQTHLFVALSTLKYLAMGGRVSNLTASFASLLNIKPILTIREGKLDMLERVRTQKKAWERVIELSAKSVGKQRIEKMCILHVNALSMARQFMQEIQGRMHCPPEISMVEITPGLSVHSGAGMVGTVFVVK